MLQILGIIGGILALSSFIPYVRGILLGRVKPQRTIFLIWTLLVLIAIFSQLAKGATNSLWLPSLQTFGGIVILLLSIKYGVGGFNKRDFIAIFFVTTGLIVWHFTKEAAIALYIVIFIDAVGLYLTLHKTYLVPESETKLAWMLSSTGGLFAALAVGNFNIILLSYPVYIIFSNAAVVVAIQMGLRRKRRK